MVLLNTNYFKNSRCLEEIYLYTELCPKKVFLRLNVDYNNNILSFNPKFLKYAHNKY